MGREHSALSQEGDNSKLLAQQRSLKGSSRTKGGWHLANEMCRNAETRRKVSQWETVVLLPDSAGPTGLPHAAGHRLLQASAWFPWSGGAPACPRVIHPAAGPRRRAPQRLRRAGWTPALSDPTTPSPLLTVLSLERARACPCWVPLPLARHTAHAIPVDQLSENQSPDYSVY